MNRDHLDPTRVHQIDRAGRGVDTFERWFFPALGFACVLLALLVCCDAAPAQLRVANISDQRQVRWVSIPVPIGTRVPETALYAERFLAVPGPTIGVHTRMVHVLADLEGGEIVDGTLRPITVPWLPTYRQHPWVSDNPLALVPFPAIRVHGVTLHGIDWTIDQVEVSRARIVTKIACRLGTGFWFECWLTAWHDQPVVDFELALTWSDRTTSSIEVPVESFTVSAIEDMHFDYGPRLGVRTESTPAGGRYSLIRSSSIADGQMAIWTGAILCREELAPALTIEAESQQMAATGHWESQLEAARGGPLVGASTLWNGHWLGTLTTPRTPVGWTWSDADQVAAAFRSFAGGHGSIWDQRPLANLLNTGSTGDQAPFGVTKDGLALWGDPRRVYELGYSATDYAMRPAHHREADGSILQAANHPGCKTWSGYPDWRNSSDMLGKPDAWPPWGWPTNDRASADDQHRGMGYILCYRALHDAFAIEHSLRHWVQTDLMQVPNRTGAARASGRLFRDWSGMILLLPDEDRQALVAHAIRRLDLLVASLNGRAGEVRPSYTLGPDPRVIPDKKVWIPWQESILASGAVAMSGALRRISDPHWEEFLDLAVRVAENQARYGAFEEAGLWWPCNGVWYDEGRPTAEYSLVSPDLLVGTQGWWNWHYAGISIARSAGVTEAQAILDQLGPPTSWRAAEWRALR